MSYPIGTKVRCLEDDSGSIDEGTVLTVQSFKIGQSKHRGGFYDFDETDNGLYDDEIELYSSASTTDAKIAELEQSLKELKEARAEELKPAKPVFELEYNGECGEHRYFSIGGGSAFATTKGPDVLELLESGADVIDVFRAHNDEDCPEGYEFVVDKIGRSIRVKLVKKGD